MELDLNMTLLKPLISQTTSIIPHITGQEVKRPQGDQASANQIPVFVDLFF
jgi:hypothetical protein